MKSRALNEYPAASILARLRPDRQFTLAVAEVADEGKPDIERAFPARLVDPALEMNIGNCPGS
jgi:hypothetical protein